MEKGTRFSRILAITLGLVVLAALSPPPAAAQRTTGAIRGTVRDGTGPVPGVVVTATNVTTGTKYTATSLADGTFMMVEVEPGEYDVTTSIEAFQDATARARVLVGQTASIDFTIALKARATEAVTVSAAAVRERDLRTPEVSTSVTPEQIQELPQSSRNFLNFAALAPGVSVTSDFGEDPRYGGAMFRSGGQDARQINVFIDGLSFKNDILKGGAFMQDSSRGNPFPQDSIAEFQVLTQNYKAEYERAAAAVINVSTKSGTNTLHGDGFFYWQSRGMVAKTQFQDRTPDYHRYQWGAAIGGPIMKDTLFGYGSYEGNDQARFQNVLFGHPPTAPPEVLAKFAAEPQGDVESPFKSTLFFGKITWTPSVGQTGELTGNIRDESDRRDFGQMRAFTTGVDQKVKTYGITGRHTSIWGNFVNSLSLSWQQMRWIQDAIDVSEPHQNYFDIGEIGGRSTIQNVRQRRVTLRDDGTLSVGSRGEHLLKAGVTAAFPTYDYDNAQDFNPNFFFRSQDRWLFPYHANFGFGVSGVSFGNTQIGVFAQDDWTITPRLTVSLGIRWDWESNMLNNDYVTPANVVAAANSATGTDYNGHIVHLGDIINLSDYISTGSNRSSYTKAIQPRFGVSFDLFGNGNTILTGAWGRYYDHINLQDIYEEQHKQTWQYYQFCFTDPRSTAPPDCATPVPWKDSYLSRAGLESLIASGQAGGPEIWFLQNSTEPPKTDQWNVGFHQRLGTFLFGMSYNGVRGKNGLIWFPAATPDASPDKPDRFGHLIHANGFGTILYSTFDRKTWYDALFVTLDRPYTSGSHWGFSIAYTYAKARQLGNENKIEGTDFGFDFFHPEFLRKVPGDNDERHHVVASGIVGIPWDIRLATFLTLGTGVPYTIFDFSREAASIRWNEGQPPRKRNIFGNWAYESWDLRLTKDIAIASGVIVGLQAEVFNVLNFKNYCGFETFYLSPNLGQPNCQYNTRRAQVGANVNF